MVLAHTFRQHLLDLTGDHVSGQLLHSPLITRKTSRIWRPLATAVDQLHRFPSHGELGFPLRDNRAPRTFAAHAWQARYSSAATLERKHDVVLWRGKKTVARAG